MEEPEEKPKTPVCQSCGMPMEKPEDFGTNGDGSPNEEFCTHCFQNGVFTEPDISMREMIEKVIGFMVNEGMPREEAEKLANDTIPRLNRWRKFGTEYL